MMGARITPAAMADRIKAAGIKPADTAALDPGPVPSIADLARNPNERRKVNRRQKASRAARTARGERQVAVWLTPEAAAALDRLMTSTRTGPPAPSATFAICTALVYFDGVIAQAVEDAMRD